MAMSVFASLRASPASVPELILLIISFLIWKS
jgi:hypothetical protein